MGAGSAPVTGRPRGTAATRGGLCLPPETSRVAVGAGGSGGPVVQRCWRSARAPRAVCFHGRPDVRSRGAAALPGGTGRERRDSFRLSPGLS